MNTSRILGATLVAFLLGACASGPKMSEVASSIPPLKADEGRIYFYRSNSMMGAAIQPSVYVDGKVVGSSKPGGFFYVDARPGSHEVACSTEVEQKLTLTLDRGQTRYVRTAISMGLLAGRVQPELVDDATGANELKSMSYIGAPLAR
jgi:hypothetical protein